MRHAPKREIYTSFRHSFLCNQEPETHSARPALPDDHGHPVGSEAEFFALSMLLHLRYPNA